MARRVLLVGGAVLAVVVLALAAYGAYLARSLDTPEFKQALLARARQALGVEVRAGDLHVSLLKGVEVETLEVANPRGFKGPLLTAGSFGLRYDLLPLLRGRLQVDELVLKKPVLNLAMDSRGSFNYEKLGSASSSTAPVPASTSAPLGAFDLVLSRAAVEDGRISVTDHRGASLLRLEGAQLKSSFAASGGTIQGKGTADVAALSLMDALFVHDLEAPLDLAARRFRLGPLRGRLAQGEASGGLDLDLERFRYVLQLDVERADVATLLREAGAAPTLAGRLHGTATIEGTGGAATLTGRGQAEVQGCRTTKAPLLLALAATLRLPELADPDFEECRAEFTLGGGRARTPVLSLKGRTVRLGGEGTMGLESGNLDYRMRLALAPALDERIPAKEIRAAFKDGGDGFRSIEFAVTGTTAAPKTDLLARIGKAGALEVVKGKLRGLFGRRP
jgi:uncharacterized protein involved in outer membrane biogenesis